jgi:hypothetical protein
MSAQTIEVRAGRGIGSKWWIALAVAVALVVTLVLMSAGSAGEKGGSTPGAGTRPGPSTTFVVGDGQAEGHPLP